MKNKMNLLTWSNGDKTVMGKTVSPYAIENGYLDYKTLADIVGDMILCNQLENSMFNDAEIENGEIEYYLNSEGDIISYEEYEKLEDEGENVTSEYHEFYQFYIISDGGAKILKEYTDEVVFYHKELEIYFWAISHWGTSWDYVLTDIKLIEEEI